MEDPTVQTFEQANAKKLNSSHTDPIHYDAKYSYRKSNYRFLHHQHGKIGTFTVRLLEAKNLKRRHWSVLGMGPMKHLGLSRAVGQVSSFATMRLHFLPRRDREDSRETSDSPPKSGNGSESASTSTSNSNTANPAVNIANDPNISWEESASLASAVTMSTNAAAAAAAAAPFTSSKMTSPNPKKTKNNSKPAKSYFSKEHRSSVVRSNSNPHWPSVQSPSNASIFDMDLTKGSMPHDGMEIYLRLQMKEEVTAADSIVPVKGGGNAILGETNIDLTPLVLRGFGSEDAYGSDDVDVWDDWIDLQPPQGSHSTNTNKNGENDQPSKVRVLISYVPAGISPRAGDVIALESFARQRFVTSSIRPLVPPLAPMRVKDVRGEYLLCGFDVQQTHDSEENNNRRRLKTIEGSVRLHRNAVFVIERTNVFDIALDAALKPADVVLSTPVARDVTQTLTPYVESAGQMLMPAVLSAKLFLEAAKVGGGAFSIGMKAALTQVAENQNPEKRRTQRRMVSDDEF